MNTNEVNKLATLILKDSQTSRKNLITPILNDYVTHSEIDHSLEAPLRSRARRGRTHHYLCFAAVSSTVVICRHHLKLEVRPPHVAVHDGRLHHAAVRLDDEAVFAVFGLFAGRRRDDEPVRHGAVVTGVSVEGLRR